MVGAGPHVFSLWPYIIANQKPSRDYGSTIELNPQLLAFIIGKGTTEKDILQAIEFLCKPDPKSRSREKDGRRLVRLGQFEYQVINGAKYRAVRDQEERKAQVREAQRRFRAKKKESKNGIQIQEEIVQRVYEAPPQGDDSEPGYPD